MIFAADLKQKNFRTVILEIILHDLLDKIVNMIPDDMILSNFNISLYLTTGVESKATVPIQGAGQARSSQHGDLVYQI